MSLPPVFQQEINTLSRNVLNDKPTDILQFCANFFNRRLESQRAEFLLLASSQHSSASPSDRAGSNMAQSSFPGASNASSNPFSGSTANPFGASKGSSPSGVNRIMEEDENDTIGSPTSQNFRAQPFSSNFGSTGPSSGVAVPAATPSPAPPSAFKQTEGQGFPSNYAMGRRTSVSAESLNPTSTSNDNWSPPFHQKTPEQLARLKTAISGNFLFSHLHDEQTSQVLGALVEKQIPAKDIKVISQGDVGDYFYVVESGDFDVYVNKAGSLQPGSNGMGDKVATVKPGGSFGELALMYNAPRAATVISTSSGSCLWALDRITFRRILMDSTFQRRRMYENFLEEVPILSTLTPYERSKIADALETQKYPPGTTIIKEGEPGEAFFILETGEAEVFKRGVDQPVKSYKKGDYFGELALLNDAPRAASVVSKSEVKLATLGKDGFQRLLGPVEGIMRRNDPTQENKA